MYRYEADLESHRKLIDLLLNIQGQAVLSGYQHELYDKLVENGWKVRRFTIGCNAVSKSRNSKYRGKGSVMKGASRVEVLWIKTNGKEESHDQRTIFTFGLRTS